MSKDEVIAIIQRAFATTERPDLAEMAHCEECEIFLGALLQTCPASWQEISWEYISLESSALTALTPRGWRFLLPAYMVWHLQHHDQPTDSNTVDTVVWNLVWKEAMDQHIADGFRSLSRQQARAVDAFLAFIAAQNHDRRLAEDAAAARRVYWARAAR